MEDFKLRAALNKDELRTLAEIGALNCFADHRRAAMWQVEKTEHPDDLSVETPKRRSARASERQSVEASSQLPRSHAPTLPRSHASPLHPMNIVERMAADYNGIGLTTGPHPMTLARPTLPNVWRACDLPKARHGIILRIAGNVICRQRPGTAKGFVFISLEDETGVSNAIVAPQLFDQCRLLITQESFLMIEGRVQNVDNVVLVKALRIEPLATKHLVGADSHDFH